MRPIPIIVSVCVVCASVGAYAVYEEMQNDDELPILEYSITGTYTGEKQCSFTATFIDKPEGTINITVHYPQGDFDCDWEDSVFTFGCAFPESHDPCTPGDPVKEEDIPSLSVEGFRCVRVS